MKKSLLLVFFSFLFCFANAQNLQIVDAVSSVKGGPDSISYIKLHIKNNGTSATEVFLKRKIQTLAAGQMSYFCFGVTCYPPNVNVSPENISLAAGATDESVKTYVDPRGSEGTSIINYCYYNVAKTDSACLLLTYDISATTGIVKNSHQKFVKVFPNPAIQDLNLVFNTEKKYSNSEIQLLDLNGRIVLTEKVELQEGLLKLDISSLHAGVYVCNLVADGNTIARDKVIIK